jgi:hypothetical protein
VVVSCRPNFKYSLQVSFLIYSSDDPDRRIALSCWYAPKELELVTVPDDGHE